MMTPENFAYWLQGYFELSGAKELTEVQVQVVKDHIALVLKKETPAIQIGTPPSQPWTIHDFYCTDQTFGTCTTTSDSLKGIKTIVTC